MARKANNEAPAATVASIPADEIAEIVAAQEAKAQNLSEVIDESGTIRDTQTVYTDRTFHPEEDRDVDFPVETVELAGGTVLTNVLAPPTEEAE